MGLIGFDPFGAVPDILSRLFDAFGAVAYQLESDFSTPSAPWLINLSQTVRRLGRCSFATIMGQFGNFGAIGIISFTPLFDTFGA